MPEDTAATGAAASTGASADVGTTSASDGASDGAKAASEASKEATDGTTGIEVEAKQGDLFDGKDTNGTTQADTDKAKVAEAKAKEEKNAKDKAKEDSSTTDDKSKDSSNSDDANEKPKTIKEMGFDNITADQQAVAELATDMGVTFDDLRDNIVDGKLDVSKLKDLSPRDAQLLRTVVDSEVIKLTNAKDARRTELYNHAGSKENFEAMVTWVNTEQKASPEFKAEVGEMVGLMKQGGQSAKVAVDALFAKFKASPNTSIPLKQSEDANVGGGKVQQTKRQERNAQWDAFQDKHKFK